MHETPTVVTLMSFVVQVKRLFKITELKPNSFCYKPKAFFKNAVYFLEGKQWLDPSKEHRALFCSELLRVCSPFWKITLAMSAPLMEFSSPLQQTCGPAPFAATDTQWFQVLGAYSAGDSFLPLYSCWAFAQLKDLLFYCKLFYFNSLCFSQFRQFRQFSQFRLINMRNWFLTILESWKSWYGDRELPGVSVIRVLIPSDFHLLKPSAL